MGHPGRSNERGAYEKKETGMFNTKSWIHYSAVLQNSTTGQV